MPRGTSTNPDRTTVAVAGEQLKRLRRVQKATSIPVANLVKVCIQEHLPELEAGRLPVPTPAEKER